MKNYPLPTEYIESIKLFKDNCFTLKELSPMFTANGDPELYYEDYCMVFKMKNHIDDEFYALICFTNDSVLGHYSLYTDIPKEIMLIGIQYLENELFVDSVVSTETEFPVIVCLWDTMSSLFDYLKGLHSESDKVIQNTSMTDSKLTIEHKLKDDFDELLFEAEKGDSAKQVELARKFYDKALYKEAYTWYEHAAMQNNGDGHNGLECCYLHGNYVDKDPQKAAQ